MTTGDTTRPGSGQFPTGGPTGAGSPQGSRLGTHRYGKSGIRLVRVTRSADRHELTDLTVDISLEGDFTGAYTDGDNRDVLPTDTMRGVVYAEAGREPVGSVEMFCCRVANTLLDLAPAARHARVSLTAEPWSRVETGERPHPHAFLRAGPARRTATVEATRGGSGDFSVNRLEIRAGLRGLTLLKTAGSAFTGFLKDDRYTTLEETTDRILATTLDAEWRFTWPEPKERSFTGPWPEDWDPVTETVTQALVTTFADHDSQSLQHTLYAMGDAVLAACPDIVEIHLTAPNKHHLLVDLSPYGQTNDNAVFVATDAPYGLIEATVTRE